MKKIRNVVLIIIALLLPAAWMTMNVVKGAKVECKVCMSFHDSENCGKAIGDDRDTCVRTAKDNACALIASGMAPSIACSQKEPLSVEVK